MRILAVNAGSSSLKLSLIDGDSTLSQRLVERWENSDVGPIASFVRDVGAPDAVAHRIVHGGGLFSAPALINDATIDTISSLTRLAPLHQPRGLAGIEATRRVLPT